MKRAVGHAAQDVGAVTEVQPARTRGQGGSTQLLLQRKTILVVDDEPTVVEVLREIFDCDGYEVQCAENGEVALEKLQHYTYDVIVSDLRMPKVDGSALYRAIKQWRPHLLQRFIFLTGDTATPGILEFLEGTGLPFMNKPFTLDVMRRAVQDVIEGNERTSFRYSRGLGEAH
jgi:CheY-like chemotaxis protein